jgi:hypothetical protein
MVLKWKNRYLKYNIMNKINALTTFVAILIMTSCEKSSTEKYPAGSINIANAIVGGTTARMGSNATNISNNNYAQMGLNVGNNNLYIWPVGDSTHPYYNAQKLVVNDGEIYSLFLSGTPASVDAVLLKDTIPFQQDSTAGIRFINLAPNTSAKPLNITLQVTPTINEVSNLAYKLYTGFKSYTGLYNSSYTFQLRNDTCAAPKAPLATISLAASAVPRFANITIVIRQNGNAISTFTVKNDR